MITEPTMLTSRQTLILKSLIDEYIDTAEPVGSAALEKKYDLGVSPATIRNEMSNLTRDGYLRQPHTSAGRVPTPTAMKFYINQLMDEKNVSVADEVKAKEGVRGVSFDGAMDYLTEALARQTKSLAVAVMDSGDVWSHGHSNVFNSPEFYDYQVCQMVFGLLDERRRLQELFFKRLTGLSPIEVLFGEELGWEFFEPIGVVAARFNLPGEREGAIGIVGPYRLNYANVIPLVRYFGKLISEIDYEKVQTQA